ncbi:MAG: hypothetical protein AAFR17_16005 [Pseudomonadota bacterium]
MQNVRHKAAAYTMSHGEVSDLHLPLKNMAFTIHHYLLENGTRLDWETRFLLAGLRDSLSTMADRQDEASDAEGRRQLHTAGPGAPADTGESIR